MLRTLAVIGTGLIGTSVALAARAQGITVYLSDRDESIARTAEELGAGLARRPPRRVDLAVVAVPPSEVGPVLVEQEAGGIAAYYTDVAAVKDAAQGHVLEKAADPSRYVGGHPMAGSERSGPHAGRADLFQGRVWVLTPSPHSSEAALERALELVRVCGAAPLLMDGREHDERMALTSHMPHVMASLTAARLAGTDPIAPGLVGQGFRDATRIARGGSALWGDILRSNAASVAAVLTELHDDLEQVRQALLLLAADEGAEAAARAVADVLDRGIAGLDGISPDGPDPELLWSVALAKKTALRRSASGSGRAATTRI